jgi:hypothetical protein
MSVSPAAQERVHRQGAAAGCPRDPVVADLDVCVIKYLSSEHQNCYADHALWQRRHLEDSVDTGPDLRTRGADPGPGDLETCLACHSPFMISEKKKTKRASEFSSKKVKPEMDEGESNPGPQWPEEVALPLRCNRSFDLDYHFFV